MLGVYQHDLIDTSLVWCANRTGRSDIVLVCEHASNFIPPEFQGLGLSNAARLSHAAWDPGARAVAVGLSTALDAVLVTPRVSRLVYDCNRPPDAASAMPERSEIYDIPGNYALDAAARQRRVSGVYDPFRAAVRDALETRRQAGRLPVLVTIHSFTPVYHGTARETEIGILHDDDSRLADAILARDGGMLGPFRLSRNDPYGPEDGVTHTLQSLGMALGCVNVMIEIRNDLIDSAAGQQIVTDLLQDRLSAALQDLALTELVNDVDGRNG
ncbi:N-formylglutamate amidohydrolase [Pacificispira spongiicola]|uniref:N-formylglutamate amidohydrolase n=1 Tax=Pacificispira spongiicola TaxID=2729598 RepID=UPI0029C9BF59|nr:N-formylglutamate amidohydrolase [Pacificispira spongiicola]